MTSIAPIAVTMTSAVLEPARTTAVGTAADMDLLAQVPGLVWSVDSDLRFTALGGSVLADIPGTDNLIGVDLFTFYGTADRAYPSVAAHLRALDGETVPYECSHAGRAFECRVRPILDGAGQVIGVSGIALDISERKARESRVSEARANAELLVQKLQQSEERSRTLLSSLPQRIFFKDADGAFVQVNELFARDLNMLPDQLVGKTDFDFFPAELAEKYRADDLRILTQRDTETLVETNVSGGSRRWVEVVKKPVLSEMGEPLGILGVFTDITERKRMEDEIAHERYLLRTLMDNIPDLIYFKDRESRFTLINRAQAAALGLESAADALGKSDHDFFPSQLADGFKNDEEQLMAAGEPLLGKVEVIEGETYGQRWLSTIKMPIFQDGEVVGMVGVSRDITERVWADQELKKAAEELERSNEDLQQFAYVASHDLQEPLRMVASYTQLLARRYKDKLDEDANEFINYAVDGATRMQGLINDLLQYSRVGTRGVSFEEMEFSAAVDRACANLRALIQETGAKITRDPLPRLEADTSQMAQLMQNLIGNSLKFRGEKAPEIHIGAKRLGGEWVISVRDNGIGIEPQYAERIFVIFQRLHTKTEYPGSGIGLSICKKIVNRHGGRIWVEPSPEGGSVFRFSLPVDRADPYEGANNQGAFSE